MNSILTTIWSKRRIAQWSLALVTLCLLSLSALWTPVSHAQATPEKAVMARGEDPDLAQATIDNPDGTPLTNAGVTVSVVPQPGADANVANTKIQAYAVGTTLNEQLAGTGTTDSQGHIHVVLTPPSPTDANFVANSSVNYEMTVTNSYGQVVKDYYFSRYYGQNAREAQSTLAHNSLAGKVLRANNAPQLPIARTQTSDNSTALAALLPTSTPKTICYSWSTYSTYDEYGIVAEIHAKNEFQVQFTYKTQDDTSFGIALNDSGGSVSDANNWSISGSAALSNSTTLSLVTQWYSNVTEYLKSKFRFTEQKRTCVTTLNGDSASYTYYRLMPTTWLGGQQDDVQSSLAYWDSFSNSSLSYTNRYDNGATFTTGTVSGYSYSAGICILVVCVNIDTSYTTSISLAFKDVSSEGYSHVLWGADSSGNLNYPTEDAIIYTAW